MEGEGSGEKCPKKFEPGWKPIRGGEKAKKQQVRAEALVAKQEAAKASGGDPSGFVVVSVAEEEFPDFRPEDRILFVPVSAPKTPPKALAKVSVPSLVVPIPKPPPIPVTIPVPIPGPRTPPKAPSPVMHPKESSVSASVLESLLERERRLEREAVINTAIETRLCQNPRSPQVFIRRFHPVHHQLHWSQRSYQRHCQRYPRPL